MERIQKTLKAGLKVLFILILVFIFISDSILFVHKFFYKGFSLFSSVIISLIN